jgi:hypothetical protein
MTGLGESWIKLDRANEHLASLQAEVTTSFAGELPGETVMLDTQFDAKMSQYVVRIERLPEAPFLRWGVVLGDFIHNVRSALDYLAWRLVEIGDQRASRLKRWRPENVYFPIYDSRERFRENCWRLPGLTLRQWAILEREQPYKRYFDTSLSPLSRLRDLSNKDKHQLVTPIKLASEDPSGLVFRANNDCRILGAMPILFVPFEVGAPVEVVSVEIVGPYPEVKVDGQMIFYIALEDGAHASLYLGNMIGATRRILEAFEPFFDSKS